MIMLKICTQVSLEAGGSKPMRRGSRLMAPKHPVQTMWVFLALHAIYVSLICACTCVLNSYQGRHQESYWSSL